MLNEHKSLPEQGSFLNYIFVYSSLDLGGVETLIIRLSNWLVQNGHNVHMILIKPGKLDHLLSPLVKVTFLGGRILASLPEGAALKTNKRIFNSADVLCAFDPQSLWLAMLCSSLCAKKTRFFLGVYHPRIFFFTQNGNVLEKLHLKLLQSCVAPNSIAFMNEACQISHEKYLGQDFSHATILPLPLIDNGIRAVKPSRLKVVSVGRLTAFKSYNIYMIEIIHELIVKGVNNLTWHVYGEGPLMAEMVSRINALDLQGHIFLHGEIPYEDMHKVISDAYVFVGMGTALIEAASYGVPSIPAIDSEGPLTYGFVYDLDGYNVGERYSEKPEVKIKYLLEKLFSMDDIEYMAESEKARMHGQKFSIDSVGNLFISRRKEFGDALSVGGLPNIYLFKYALIVILESFASILGHFLINLSKNILPKSIFVKLKIYNRKRLAARNRVEIGKFVDQDSVIKKVEN